MLWRLYNVIMYTCISDVSRRKNAFTQPVILKVSGLGAQGSSGKGQCKVRACVIGGGELGQGVVFGIIP